MQDRSILSDLLWHEVGEQHARKNLRNLLYSLRQSIGDYVDSSRQAVSFAGNQLYWLNVEVFSNYWATPENDPEHEILPEVLRLYQGDFLQGFAIQGAPAFDDWLLAQRHTLQDQAIQGFHHLMQHYLVTGDYEAGLLAGRRLLAMAPWHESADRHQMLLLAHSDQRSAALAQYALCQQALAEEYGVAPRAETTALYMQIKAGELEGPAQKEMPAELTYVADERPTPPIQLPAAVPHSPGRPSPMLPQVNWDAIPTSHHLYGRETELSQLEQWIVTAQCRVIAVVGLGGQGKTPLLAELVHCLAEEAEGPRQAKRPNGLHEPRFTHILWTSVMGDSSLAQILYGWLQQLVPQSEPRIQPHAWPPLDFLFARLTYHLRTVRCLLILDQTATGKILRYQLRQTPN